MARLARRLLRDTRGASAVEYGLIVTLVVIAMVAALTAFANTSVSMWNDVSNRVTHAQ